MLKELQAEQIEYRDRDGGYWIAEADPAAAHRARQQPRPRRGSSVRAGNRWHRDVLDHLKLRSWSTIASKNSDELDTSLQQCQEWEVVNDPDGKELPRAKRHDDKALAVVNW